MLVNAINTEKKRQIKETSFSESEKYSLMTMSSSKSFEDFFFKKNPFSVEKLSIVINAVQMKTKEYFAVREIENTDFAVNITSIVIKIAETEETADTRSNLFSVFNTIFTSSGRRIMESTITESIIIS